MSASAPVVAATTPATYAAAPVTYVQMPTVSSVSVPAGGSVAVPQVMYAAPAVFNIPPELFAKLASGGAMTPEEMAQITGGPAPAPVATPEAAPIT
eukprot:CAMPEP_0195097234 /NCGR_PEP_ID=MMETSP0448-20130528/52021_1 /TAXON_ID=66468 /ORGANISM="Heterocapsa triquestra, Strain CCMP 448" /LENGTH=95 /DNA_ID=CAMNT_0040131725 /DNA_START=83 /DNA_END=366 /DNA_ORIENTATION=+